MKRSFFWLIAAFVLLLALGVWLLMLGVRGAPFTSPFATSL